MRVARHGCDRRMGWSCLVEQEGPRHPDGARHPQFGSIELLASALLSDEIVHASIMLSRSWHKPLSRAGFGIWLTVLLRR